MYLNNHSYYSLRYGTISEEELLELASQEGCPFFTLTDINNTSACLNFIRRAKEKNIKPIVGVDFRNGNAQCYVILAQNNNGFLQMNRFLSEHLRNKTEFPERAPRFEDAVVIYPFNQSLNIKIAPLAANEYIGIRHADLNRLKISTHYDQPHKLVALHTVSYRNKLDYNTHRLLRSIDTNVLLSMLATSEQANSADRWITIGQFKELYKNDYYLIENANKLLKGCQIDFDFSKHKLSQNRSVVYKNSEEDYERLIALCKKGLKERYAHEITYKIKRRVLKELRLIKQQHYVAFFLINWKIITYARSRGYFYIGRGSGANSIVAYLLRITDVDPIELDLYFERFMNIYRATPPDFDIDFSTWDREDVTSYIFNEFSPKGQVALLGSYVTFKHSGAVRELGKVFGLPKYEIDKLSKGSYNPNELDDIKSIILKYAKVLNGRPNYCSIHAAGILISEKPIHYFSATNFPPKGFPTVQFDMHIAEDVGLYKFDILGQRGLGKIKDAIQLIKENNPDVKLVDIHNTKQFFKDRKINEMISKADCVGCFYVESPAMRMLLKKLGVSDYLTLVAASSIIRPGVAKSGMMREFILRHKDPQRALKKGHPILLEIMPDTYGVMVYQEDVIKVAHHYAGLDLGEADVLRRGMSGKYRSKKEFLEVKTKFKSNCISKGESMDVINEVWRQIESFAGYAFAKGHSASYAVESYQSLYLKCYFPLEYMVATINNGGGFYSTETYVQEARLKGATVLPPCINESDIKTIIRGKDIYLGFQHIQSLEKINMVLIVNARVQGKFISLDEFLERVPMSIDQLAILIRIEAFRCFHKNQRHLLWEAHYKANNVVRIRSQKNLFNISLKRFELPNFYIPDVEKAFDQMEILHFPLFHPFILLKKKPTSTLTANELKNCVTQNVEIYGYLVTYKTTRTSSGSLMSFGTFIDRKGDWIDTVHFPTSLRNYRFDGKGVYKIVGKVTLEFNFVTIEVSRLIRQHYRSDTKTTTFHKSEASKQHQH